MVIGIVRQDTIRLKKVAGQDSLKQISDTSVQKPATPQGDLLKQKSLYLHQIVKTNDSDTSAYCVRNSIADVTFYDSVNLVTQISEGNLPNSLIVFTELNRKFREETKASLVKNLKSGEEMTPIPFRYDWVLPVILSAILIYGVIRSLSGNLFNRLIRFISFRPANENTSRDTISLFHWQSSLFNLASFINISLFGFFASQRYGLITWGDSWFLYWLGLLAIVIAAFTLRIFASLLTGSISDQREAFNEYLQEVCQAYRLAGLALLAINILIVYTEILPADLLFYSGFSLLALSYFIRVLKLFIIFINRHIPIFYLILYLCALEILPVVITVKYITGLV